ncbi:MAG: ATP-binding protein [Armatimonadetes bacterium]|nr:ATP-binding protein [Armatimonadota bacterium]
MNADASGHDGLCWRTVLRQGEVMLLEIPSSTEYVSIACHAIEGIARRMTFTANEVEDIKLAVGEACTNAVKHGPALEESPNVEIKCSVHPDGLTVEIRNSTIGRVHPHIPTKLDASHESGRGLYMMRKLVDEVDMKWEHCSATVKLFKKLTATAA